jgi:hypothetical protein
MKSAFLSNYLHSLCAALTTAVLASSLTFGQIVKLTDQDSFSEDAVYLNFGDIGRGYEAAAAYRDLGVFFTGEGNSRPARSTALIGVWEFEAVLQNQPFESSAGEALIIRFDEPARRAGFRLGNGKPETRATISAFTARGEALGSVEQDGLVAMRGVFVGLEAGHPDGMSTIVVDYGDDQNGEQIHRLWVDFLVPPSFCVCSAQIGMGVADGISVETHVQVVNPFSQPLDVRLSFRDPDGLPLPVPSLGEGGAEFDLTLPGLRSRQFKLRSDGELRTGYLCLESRLPVDAQAIFVIQSATGEVVTEAAVRADPPRTRQNAAVEFDVSSGLDTGLAIANPNDQDAWIAFYLRDESTGSTLRQRTIAIPAGVQQALFLNEMFAPRPNSDDPPLPDAFQGYLEIASYPPVSVTTMRTCHGIARSSLPVSSTRR